MAFEDANSKQLFDRLRLKVAHSADGTAIVIELATRFTAIQTELDDLKRKIRGTVDIIRDIGNFGRSDPTFGDGH